MSVYVAGKGRPVFEVRRISPDGRMRVVEFSASLGQAAQLACRVVEEIDFLRRLGVGEAWRTKVLEDGGQWHVLRLADVFDARMRTEWLPEQVAAMVSEGCPHAQDYWVAS